MKYFFYLISIFLSIIIVRSRTPLNSKEMIKNGDFKSVPYTEFFLKNVPYWKSTDNFEMGIANQVNPKWGPNKYILETDVHQNVVISQEFYIDSDYNCQFTMFYSSKIGGGDGLFVKFNNIQILSDPILTNDNIRYFTYGITTKSGTNIVEIGGSGISDSNGAWFTDVSIKCPDFNNYIFFIAEGNYELYKDGNLFSSGAVNSIGKYISLGSLTNTLLEIKISSITPNPRFIATIVYKYNNYQEYVVNTNENWIVDNLHAIELTDTDHTSNTNYGNTLEASAKWIKSSFSNLKETIFTIVIDDK